MIRDDLWKTLPRSQVIDNKLLEIPGIHKQSGKYYYHVSHAPIIGKPTWEESKPVTRDPPKGITLRPQQELGKEWLLKRRGGILAYEMRLGKTLTALSCVDDWPLVIIGPLMVEPVWREWCELLFPDKEFVHFDPKNPLGLDHNRIIYLNYERVAKFRSFIDNPHPNIGVLIIDEAHRLQGWKQTRAGSTIAGFTVNARRRIALTGSPMWNRTKSLWGMLSLVNPGAWGSFHEFGVRYCAGVPDGYGWKYEGVSNQEELAERRAHSLKRELWSTWGGCKVDRRNHLVDIDSDLIRPFNTHSISGLSGFKLALGKAKVAQAIDYIKGLDNHKGPIEPLVIWVYHREVGEEIKKALSTKLFVHGALTLSRRMKLIEKWREQGGYLILTMPCAQEGIDLSKADTSVFVELDYTPAVVAQAEMRIYDPKRAKNETIFITAKGAEETLAKHLISKGEQEREVLGSTSVPLEVLEDLSSRIKVPTSLLSQTFLSNLESIF